MWLLLQVLTTLLTYINNANKKKTIKKVEMT